MGNTRLGRPPRTRRRQEVVALTGAGKTFDFAAAIPDASKRGLHKATNDRALVHPFWLFTHLRLCARETDFIDPLATVGVSVADEPRLMERYGESTLRPDFSVRVSAVYGDAEDSWFKSSADLTYIRSQGR